MSKGTFLILLGVTVFTASSAAAPGARAQEAQQKSLSPPAAPAPDGPAESTPDDPEEASSDSIAEEEGEDEAPDSDGDADEEGSERPVAVPSLARVIELARDHAPAVSVARADVEVGKASFARARLIPLDNPYLEVFSDRGSQNATRDVTVTSNLWLPVEVAGQREKREAAAQALVDWRRAELESTRASAVAGAVRSYGELVVAGARIRALTELEQVAREEAAYYQGRLESGGATIADAKLAELELAKHRVALAEGRAERVRALTSLGLATGATYTEGPAGAPEPPAPRIKVASAKKAAALPSVKASDAQARYHAREKERAAADAHTPVNLILTVGRGDAGELRLGGGISWTFPILRRNQGEQAEADANRRKATLERDLKKRAAKITVEGLVRERAEVRKAIEAITTVAEPAAQAAVDAAVATQRAGKGDLLRVLSARRDLALLKGRRLELLQREWGLVSDLVAITGELP